MDPHEGCLGGFAVGATYYYGVLLYLELSISSVFTLGVRYTALPNA